MEKRGRPQHHSWLLVVRSSRIRRWLLVRYEIHSGFGNNGVQVEYDGIGEGKLQQDEATTR